MSSLLCPEDRVRTERTDRSVRATEGTVCATVTTVTAHHALRALSEAGLDPEVAARRAGLASMEAPEFRQRVPLDVVERLFAIGEELLGADFPLLARPLRAEDNYSPVALYCRSRRTLWECTRAMCALHPLVTDGYALRLDEDTDGAWIIWCGPPRPALWWFDLADIIENLGNMLPGRPRPEAIRAPFPAPPGAKALFGVEPERHPTFAFRVPASLLGSALSPTDPALRAHIERQIDALKRAPRTEHSIVTALWALGPTATAPRLAALVGVSERTMHRRLALAGTSFRAELDAVRAQYARTTSGRSAEELAELLGYSDARALRRAARRWADAPSRERRAG